MPFPLKDVKAVPTYFKGDPRYVRTTTLVHKQTGAVLATGMGICTRRSLYAAYLNNIKLHHQG